VVRVCFLFDANETWASCFSQATTKLWDGKGFLAFEKGDGISTAPLKRNLGFYTFVQRLVSRSRALDAGQTCAGHSRIIAGFVCLWRPCFLAGRLTPLILFFLISSSVWDGNRLLRFSRPQNFKHHISNKKRVLALVRDTLRSPVVGGLSPLCENGIFSLLFARCRGSCLPLNKKIVLRDSSI